MPERHGKIKITMSHWNYRVFSHPGSLGNDEWYDIREVFYDDSGHPEGTTMEACHPCGDSLEDIENDLKYMMQALKKPVLTLADFPDDDAVKVAAENDEKEGEEQTK
jgi:hypothetical protein